VLTKQEQWEKLYGYILGNQATWVADIGLKAGLFAAIAETGEAGIQDAALAEQLGFTPRLVWIWCRAAYAFELLEWDEQRGYRLAPHMETLLLDSADPQFMGGRMQFFAALYEDFKAFPRYLERGGTWPRSEHDPWLLLALKNSTKPDAAVIADVVLPQAPRALAQVEGGGTIVDIGAGAGYAIIHYARRFPRAHVLGLEYDWPSVELARAAVAEAGLHGRVEVRHADAHELDAENAYAAVTLNITLHECGNGPEEYLDVLRRVRRALVPGGAVIVSELPYPDSPSAYRESPVYRGLAGVGIHEALVGCGMITQGQLRELLLEAGFPNPRVAEQPLPTRFVMIAEP